MVSTRSVKSVCFNASRLPFGEPAPGARDDEPGGGEKVVFTEDEVRCEVVRRPRIE